MSLHSPWLGNDYSPGSPPKFRYPYDPGDGREDVEAGRDVLRVLRGGAFAFVAGSVRCACRDRYDPGIRDWNFGFRVVASPVRLCAPGRPGAQRRAGPLASGTLESARSAIEIEGETLNKLYEQVCTWHNLYLAWRKAARGKRGRGPAAAFEYRLSENH